MIRTHAPFTIQPGRVARVLGATVCVLALASLSVQFVMRATSLAIPGLVKLDMDWEASVPTYVSALLLLASGVLAALIAWSEEEMATAYRRHWKVLAWIFVFLSTDEIASFHEGLIEPVRHALGTGGVFFYAWVIPGAAAVLVFAAGFASFWWRLPVPERGLVALAGVVYVGGALGVEMLGGLYADRHGIETFAYAALTTLEETLEMAGLVLFVYALLRYLGRTRPDLYVNVARA